MDAFYCLHHIRFELNALEAKERPESKPGIHWAHFYGDGKDGGQPGPPVSDVHEVLNRYAAQEALKYAPEAMHDGIWDLDAVEVYGSNIADLSPNVTQIHDIRWVFQGGSPDFDFISYWNSGFVSNDYANECICANWLAWHVKKDDLAVRYINMAAWAEESQTKTIEFNQPIPVGAQIGYPPFPGVDGCERNTRNWPGCS